MEHRLQDQTEGIYSLRSPLEEVDVDGDFAGFSISGITMQQAGGVRLLRRDINAYVFCCTRGNYAGRRHKAILRKNPSLVHFVVFDTHRFLIATEALCRAACPIDPPALLYGNVVYARDREDVDTTGRIGGRTIGQMVEKAVFTKPDTFAHEHELRFAVDSMAEHGDRAIFTRDFGRPITSLFAAAVVRHGRIAEGFAPRATSSGTNAS